MEKTTKEAKEEAPALFSLPLRGVGNYHYGFIVPRK